MIELQMALDNFSEDSRKLLSKDCNKYDGKPVTMYPANELGERTSRKDRETVPGSVRVTMPTSPGVRHFSEGKGKSQ